MILTSNVHLKPLNQSYKKVEQDPNRVLVKALFSKSCNNGSMQ